ncbi:MAG: PAS domain S-box protein, partial [Ignavibacteriaceae bacterium]|nr:PAS domain S-box protein [Ignavibacteriaceae bacterium]
IIAIKIELDKFLHLQNKYPNFLNVKYDVWMIDKERNILYGPNHPALRGQNLNELNIECRQCHENFNYATRMFNQNRGVMEYPALTDEGKAAAFSTMHFNNADWRIVVTAPSRKITESIVGAWSKLIILMILVFCIIAIAVWYVFKAYKSKVKSKEEIKNLKEKEYLTGQLVEKGKEYEELFENNPMPMWVYDLDTLKFLLVNDAAVYHYGYSKEEFLSMTLKDIRPETELEKLNSNLMLPENEIEVSNSWFHKKKDGAIINVEIYSHSLPVKNGLHSRLVMAKDVTEKYRLNKELKESEQRYKQLIEQSMVGILISSIDGKIKFANLKACELLNYTYEELTSLAIPDTYVDDENEVAADRIRNIQTEGMLYFERKVKRKDGSCFYADVIASKFGDGKIQSLINDITNRKKAEEELYRSEKQYKAFFEDDLTGVFSSNIFGHMITCNPSFLRIFDFKSIEEVLAYDLYNLYPSREARDSLLRKLKEEKRLEYFEIEMCSKTGRHLFILETMLGTFNTANELIEIKGYMIDITARKIAELQLRTISQIVEQSPLSIVITDRNGIIEYSNQKYLETSGFALNEIIGKKYSGLEKGLSLTGEAKAFLSAIDSDLEWKGELQYINRDGSVTWEMVSAVAIKDPSGEIAHKAVLTENITDKKRSEEYLVHSETRLRSVWENTSDAMRLINKDGIIINVNEAFCRLVNKTKQELIGSPFQIIYNGLSEESLKNFKEHFLEGTLTGIKEFESVLWDNRKIWVELSNSFIEVENQQNILLSIFRDITLRKEAEAQLVASKNKAEELNKLKDNFLSNMSHELRTPMIGIMGFSQLLSVNLDDHDFREMAQTIYMSGKRLLRTMDMIIDLSRIESSKVDLELKELNICEIIKNEVRSFENEALNKKLYLKINIKSEEIYALLDEKLFIQVLDNLISNGIKFTKTGGVTIEVFQEEIDNNTYPIIKIIDTGIGIEKENLDLIFHEFRQASEGYRRKFEGVGLGLSISKRFVDIMNGALSVASKLGEGSVFTLKLFKRNEAKELSGIKETGLIAAAMPTDWENNKILLVDDDESTAEIVKLVLKKIVAVYIAGSGEMALEMVMKNKYDIILMDIVLGSGMNGIETTKKIREITGYETIPIIALTAYAMPEDKPKFISEGLTHYVSKPFDLNQFRNFIVELLKSKR